MKRISRKKYHVLTTLWVNVQLKIELKSFNLVINKNRPNKTIKQIMYLCYRLQVLYSSIKWNTQANSAICVVCVHTCKKLDFAKFKWSRVMETLSKNTVKRKHANSVILLAMKSGGGYPEPCGNVLMNSLCDFQKRRKFTTYRLWLECAATTDKSAQLWTEFQRHAAIPRDTTIWSGLQCGFFLRIVYFLHLHVKILKLFLKTTFF